MSTTRMKLQGFFWRFNDSNRDSIKKQFCYKIMEPKARYPFVYAVYRKTQPK